MARLEIFRGLGVPEGWFWIDDHIGIYRLVDDPYERVERSAFVPDLDPALIARFATRDDQLDALREFERIVRGS